jgi:serine/threonine-protein kinase
VALNQVTAIREPDGDRDRAAGPVVRPAPTCHHQRQPMDPGETHLDKYELLALLARGGMAEILLARQQGVGFSRLVVIKRILPHLAEDPALVAMFLEEAQHAALITHPNVVQIHDVGHHEGSHYIAMELIRGPTVEEMNRAARRRARLLPLAVAAEIVVQACEGLHAAHELCDERGRHLGLVHRDVSPHNLMVTEAGVVKLVDFGIAKVRTTAMRTESGRIRGKGPYMAPEQTLGRALDRRADIFSLGTTFYELLVGVALFDRDTVFNTLKAINEDVIPPPSSVRLDVPEWIDAVVMRSLERDPELRYESAAEMGEELRLVREQHGLEGSPHLLVTHLGTECADLLALQAETIRTASELPHGPGPLPRLPGFDMTTSQVGPAARGRRLWPAIAALCVAIACGAGIVLWAVFRGAPSAPDRSGPAVVLGVAPVFNREQARKEVRPLLDYLERKVGRRFKLRVPRDYESLRSGLGLGAFDLAVLNHLQFLLARRETPGIVSLATQTYERSSSYRSEIVVRDNAGIQKVADLAGRRFCYVTPGSASGFIVPRYFFRRQGLDPERDLPGPRYSGDHAQVLRDVIRGRCDAGAVSSGAFYRAPRQGIATSRLKILATAGQIPMDIVCARPRLPARLRGAIRRALVAFRPQKHSGRPTVGERYPVDGFRAEVPDFSLFERAAREEGILPELKPRR